MPNGDCVITHREYIGEIIQGSVISNFYVNPYVINAGNQSMFAWLSTIAQNFESYRFEKLDFEFETEASTTLGGSVIMAVDYDPSDKQPQNKQQAMTYRGSVRSPPWADSVHKSLQEDLNKRKSYFVQSYSLQTDPENSSRLSDVGNLFVCTQGIASGNTAGELYVSYRCRLMTPVYGSQTKNGIFLNNGAVNATAPYPLGYDYLNKVLPAQYVVGGQLLIVPYETNAGGDAQFKVFGMRIGRNYYVSAYVKAAVVTGKLELSFINATVSIDASSTVAAQTSESTLIAVTPSGNFLTDKYVIIVVADNTVTTLTTPTQSGLVISEQPNF